MQQENMTIRRKPRRKSTPLVAVDKIVSRGGVNKLLERTIMQDSRTQEEIAALAGITSRHLRRVMDGQSSNTAIHVLRAMGYEVTETIHVKGEPDE